MYSLDGHVLQHVSDNPYLGLQFSSNLKWNIHISKVANKANSTLGFLRRNLKFCPKACKLTAYVSLVRSTLEYGSIVWDPYLKQDVDMLEKIQRKAARFILNDYRSRTPGSVSNMLDELDLSPLIHRRQQNRLVFFYKIVSGLVPAINSDTYLKRVTNKRRIKPKVLDNYRVTNVVSKFARKNENCYQTVPANCDQYKQSFFVKTVELWNNLSEKTVRSKSVDNFKINLLIELKKD